MVYFICCILYVVKFVLKVICCTLFVFFLKLRVVYYYFFVICCMFYVVGYLPYVYLLYVICFCVYVVCTETFKFFCFHLYGPGREFDFNDRRLIADIQQAATNKIGPSSTNR